MGKFIIGFALAVVFSNSALAQTPEQQAEIDRIKNEAIIKYQAQMASQANTQCAAGYTYTSNMGCVSTSSTNAISPDVETAAAEGADPKGSLPQCTEPAEKARSLCTLGDSNMSAQLQMAVNNASQMMSSGGTEAACKAAKGVQALAGAANTAHAALCQAALSKCVSSCKMVTEAVEYSATHPEDPNHSLSKKQFNAAKSKINMCKDLQAHVITAGMMAMQNVLGFALSGKCQKAVANSTPPPGSTPQPYDCTNPMMASSPQCVCAANPADPVCTASNGGLGDGFSSVGDASGAFDGGKDPEMFGFGDDIPLLEPSAAGGGLAQGSSGGGGGMNGGSGAGALPPEEMGGGPGSGPYNTDIMGGLTGGGGGGAGSYGRGGSGEGSGGGGLLDSLAEKFNLKGFLPSKADFKNRGLASGSGADGITGPNGPSLFEKVSSRYLKKQSELLP